MLDNTSAWNCEHFPNPTKDLPYFVECFKVMEREHIIYEYRNISFSDEQQKIPWSRGRQIRVLQVSSI